MINKHFRGKLDGSKIAFLYSNLEFWKIYKLDRLPVMNPAAGHWKVQVGEQEVLETNEDSMMKDSNWKIKDFHNVSRVLRHR